MRRVISTLILLFCITTIAVGQSTYQSALKAKAAKGATIYGTVECDGVPIEGVVVSDGYEVVTTNKKGVYNIASEKRNGLVFITIPSCYEAPCSGNDPVPAYWAKLSAEPTVAERHDFVLTKVDNRRHAILAVTDIHLSNQVDDINQFRNNALPRIRERAEHYRKQGIPVYTICAGDSSFDLFWYDFLFDINDFRRLIADEKYPTPFFHSMGNHDHDGATPHSPQTDFLADAKARQVFGPTYYSFNLGDVHYVMLDNIEYINSPGGKPGKGIVGAREYAHRVTQNQLDWLKKDLAYVPTDMPVVIGMHCPVLRYKNYEAKEINTIFTNTTRKRNNWVEAGRLTEVLKEHKNVHFITGHTHHHRTVYGKIDATRPNIANIVDHNVSAICGAWWFTAAHGGVHLAPDGIPAGFEVFDVDGSNLSWYFTSIDDGCERQFRTFDLNEVGRYYKTDGEVRVFLSHYNQRTDFAAYAAENPNQVMICVWGWDPTWKVRAWEGERELSVEHKPMENPQYTVAYFVPKSVWRRELNVKGNNKAPLMPNMFIVQCASPTSAVKVEVTDAFGRTYTEVMERPKAFSKTMR